MIGSRRYPCGHGTIKVPDQPGVHHRACRVCKERYTVTVELAGYVSERIGHPVHKVSWHRTEEAA